MPGSRVALVTGASSGIGAQTALLLQAGGFTVYGPRAGWSACSRWLTRASARSAWIRARPHPHRVERYRQAEHAEDLRRDGLRQPGQVGGRRLESADSPRTASGPDVVARKIVTAATTRNPRARYPVGKGAGTIVRARKVLPDSALDAVISRAYQR